MSILSKLRHRAGIALTRLRLSFFNAFIDATEAVTRFLQARTDAAYLQVDHAETLLFRAHMSEKWPITKTTKGAPSSAASPAPSAGRETT